MRRSTPDWVRSRIMAAIGFIGLGNMGAPMAANLVKAGHQVTGFDLVAHSVKALVENGGRRAPGPPGAASPAHITCTQRPPTPPAPEAAYLVARVFPTPRL